MEILGRGVALQMSQGLPVGAPLLCISHPHPLGLSHFKNNLFFCIGWHISLIAAVDLEWCDAKKQNYACLFKFLLAQLVDFPRCLWQPGKLSLISV